MTIKLLFAAAAVTVLGPLTLAQAQDSSGKIVCERDVRATSDYLDSNRDRLSADAINSAERQLDIARSQCNSSPPTGLTTAAQLRRDLGMEVETQTAQQPGEEPQEMGD